MITVVRGMTSLHRLTAVVAALLLAGCAAPADGAAPAPSAPASASATGAGTPADPADGGLALQFSHVDGCAPPGHAFSRLPVVSVYADGRFLTQGASPAGYPGPALPGMLLSRLEPAQVEELVRRALDAGLGEGSDLGVPSTAEAAWARVTVVTGGGTAVTDLHFPAGCPSGDSPPTGLADEDRDALMALVEDLTAMGRDAASKPGSTDLYEPESVAAVVTEWADPDDGLRHEPIPWPGSPLPGKALDQARGVSCVTATGQMADAVLAAAKSAKSVTPWTGGEGRRWAVALRPLLPHERSCADLPEA